MEINIGLNTFLCYISLLACQPTTTQIYQPLPTTPPPVSLIQTMFLLLFPKTINSSFYSFSSKSTTYYILLGMLSEYDVLCCFRYLGNVKHFATVFYLLKLAVHSKRHASMLSTVNTSCAMPHRKQHRL